MFRLATVVRRTLALKPIHSIAQRGFANRFPRRTGIARSNVAVRETASPASGDVVAASKIEGSDSQIAAVRLTPSQSIKVDPSAIVMVPLGVEVRPIYGAPVPIQQEQPAQASGGFLSRLREAPKSQQQAPDALVLAEILLQPGHAMPADSVQLAPVTSSKLQTLHLTDYGNEMYIARGAFMAGSVTANLHNVPPSTIPGLSLQRVDGEGSIIVKISGQPIFKNLGEGEQIFVQPNRIVAVESSTQVLGAPNTLLANIVGPGRVVLQSLPSLEQAMVSQAEATNQALQAGGVSNSMSTPFGMGGGLGSMVMQGAAFGVGSAIAHRAFDSAFGGHSAAPAPEAPAAEAPPADMSQQNDSMIQDDSGSDGSFFGSMFGGGDEDGGDEGDDGDW